MRIVFLTPILALFAAPMVLAEETARTKAAQAAGYMAAFTCSASFNAGRTFQQIKGDELHRIYPDFRENLAALPTPLIDREQKLVSVKYADDMPPRIAAWRASLGCAQLPVGASAAMAEHLPRANIAPYANTSKLDWPQGDVLKAELYTSTKDGAALQKTIMHAFDRATYGTGTETTAVLVIKDGKILGEHYRDGFDMHTPQRTWSVAKSIAASVIGAAVMDGIIDVDSPANLPEWAALNDPRQAITLRHLLHMASGLDSNQRGNRTDAIYFGGGSIIDTAGRATLEAKPGTRWKYANNDTMLAMRTLRTAMNEDSTYWQYPFKRLLGPLGMAHTTPETDWNGDFVMSSQIWTTARDLGRLGLLYLADGLWNKKRLLPEGWAEFVSTPAPDQPRSRNANNPRPGYGAQFWLYGPRHSLPAGTYAAQGNRGQYLMIVPARNIIIVRRGFDDNGGAHFDLQGFTKAVLAAVP